MRNCIVTIRDYVQADSSAVGYYKDRVVPAKFHQFVTEAIDSSIVTMAVVEYEDGSVGLTALHLLRFLPEEPDNSKQNASDHFITSLSATLNEFYYNLSSLRR